MDLTPQLRKQIIASQRNELTEYHIYSKLAGLTNNQQNRSVLQRIADQERSHYEFWKRLSGTELAPNKFKIFYYTLIVRLLGINFGVRLMEAGEAQAQQIYQQLSQVDPQVASYLMVEEQRHEQDLLDLIDTKYLQYSGSFVLGLSDAIVELSGALAGLTLALRHTNLIGIIGMITGIAASLSMAGSEYLSTKEEGGKNALQASIFTGIAYITAVIILISPYFILTNPFAALGGTLVLALLVVLVFTFYISVSKHVSFKERFFSMAAISLGVAVINFFIGLGVRHFFHIDI